jgi:hypothetical protein
MQYPIEVQGTYLQQIQTIHPDNLAVALFWYGAIVNADESVEIKSVYRVDVPESFKVRITPNSEHDTAMQRFLAKIREHARAIAYEQSKNKQ